MATQRSRDEVLRAAWRVIASVPKGRVIAYGEVARAVGPPLGPRGVSWTLRQAPAGLDLPWHRVVAADGSISVPGETGHEQRVRLKLEGIGFRGRRVDIARYGWKPNDDGA